MQSSTYVHRLLHLFPLLDGVIQQDFSGNRFVISIVDHYFKFPSEIKISKHYLDSGSLLLNKVHLELFLVPHSYYIFLAYMRVNTKKVMLQILFR